MAARLASLAIRAPRTVAGILLALSILAALGTPRLTSVSFLEGHLPPGDPELLRFETLEREFGSSRVAILAIGCETLRPNGRPCRDVFEPRVLRLLHELTERGRARRGVEEALSLASAGVLVSSEQGLRSERLASLDDQAAIGRFRSLVERDPLLPRTLVSPDLRAAAVVVRFDPELPDAERNGVVLAMLEEARTLASDAGFELQATGDVVFGAVSNQYVQADLARLTPIMLLLLVLALVWIFRERVSVALALAAVVLPSVWVFGLMGWTGRPVTPVVSTLPILILVVGVTDVVHFLVRLHELRGDGDRLADVTLEVARDVGPPTTVTALTSALGFLSFLAGPIPNLRDFGVFAAVGILGAWLTTFTLLPLVLARRGDRFQPRARPSFVAGDRLLAVLHRFAHRRAALVVGLAVLASGLSLLGLSRLEVWNDGLKLFGRSDPLARSDRFVRRHLGGGGFVELVYEAAPDATIPDPAVLRTLEEVESLFLSEPGFGPVLSLLPVLRVANRELAGSELRLPQSREAATQLLLLAEAADAPTVHRVVTPDHALARLSVGSRWDELRDVAYALDRVRSPLAARLDGAGRWFLSGALLVAMHIGDLVLESQIASFASAFLSIFAVILFFVRSLSLGALGMVPNVLPVLATLGLMGHGGISLDVATAMIASIVLGVSVDDTVYFLLHYQRARAAGAGVRDATAHTFSVAGKPALWCASMLALGFFVLGFSSFRGLALFGILSGVAVLLAAAVELLLLPALLEVSARREERA